MSHAAFTSYHITVSGLDPPHQTTHGAVEYDNVVGLPQPIVAESGKVMKRDKCSRMIPEACCSMPSSCLLHDEPKMCQRLQPQGLLPTSLDVGVSMKLKKCM